MMVKRVLRFGSGCSPSVQVLAGLRLAAACLALQASECRDGFSGFRVKGDLVQEFRLQDAGTPSAGMWVQGMSTAYTPIIAASNMRGPMFFAPWRPSHLPPRPPPWASGSPTGFFSLTMANLWRHPTGYLRASLGRSFTSND